MALIKSITEKLLEKDYMIVPQMCDSDVIGEESKYITYFKYVGATLYAVSIINETTPYNYRMAHTILRNRFYSHVKNTNCSRAFFVGIFIGSGEELEEYCTNNIEDYTAFVNEIRWILDKKSKKITVLGEQPSKIIDLNEIIYSALAADNNGYSVSVKMDDLINNERVRRIGTIKSRNTVLTFLLIAINCFALIATYLNGGTDVDTMSTMGALNTELLSDLSEYYRFFTSMFLHYGVMHLICNMLFLYVFGSEIERFYGKAKFLLIYIGSGIAGGLLYVAVSHGVAAGASGAVFGLAAAVLAYSIKIGRSVNGKDTYFMLMYVIISLACGFLDENTANSAHIGGAIFGFISAFLLYDGE